MTPEAFEDALLERFAEFDDVEVAHVDCAEYPCVAALRFSGDDASMNWGDEVGETIGAWAADAYGEQHSLSVNRSRFSSNGHEARYVLFAAHDGQRDDAVGTRTGFRIDDLVDQLGEEVAQEAEDAP